MRFRSTPLAVKSGGALALAVVLLAGAGQSRADPAPFTFTMTAGYAFGVAPDAGPGAAPDTGFVQFTNVGPATFTGTLSLDGTSPGQGHLNTTLGITLAPGFSKVLTLSDESSNQGGWNKVGGGLPDLGIEVEAKGTFSAPGFFDVFVDLDVHDPDFHSGVPRTNPLGETLDNYILQGGDSMGNDTGDGYETTQAPATLTFSNASAVPEIGPGSVASAMTLLVGGVWTLRGRRRQQGFA
jgi:hypothetical protein